MAVDSRAKRFSMVTFGGDGFAATVPEDGNHEQDEERLNEVFLYYGLGAGAPPAITSGGDRRRRNGYIRRGARRS